tara:strand:- start:262 stop:465 length:204 start_codon:yes stop_codon:yes gene_type:complete
MKKKTFNEFLADFNVIQQVPQNWKKEREKAVKNVPFVIDIRGERGRQKDLDQQRMYNDPDENYSGLR